MRAIGEGELVHLFADSRPLDGGNEHIRAYNEPGDEHPSLAIRQASYYPRFGPSHHMEHLEALKASGVNVPQTHIDTSANDAYIASQWIHHEPSASARLLEPEYIAHFNSALDGLDRYHQWAKKAGGVIMHDIFGLGQFVYGSETPGAEPSLWLIDVEPLIKPVESFELRVDTLRDMLHIFAGIERCRYPRA